MSKIHELVLGFVLHSPYSTDPKISFSETGHSRVYVKEGSSDFAHLKELYVLDTITLCVDYIENKNVTF